jgi:hypothetical protein
MIESVRYYIARCDRCKTSHIGVSTDYDKAVERARESGWIVLKDGYVCICPDCDKKNNGATR